MPHCINNYLHVRFEPTGKRTIAGVELVIPDKWHHAQADDQAPTKFEENTNYLETKPQICTVLMANRNYPYKVGDRLFVHYMAAVTAINGDITTGEATILAEYVFFTIHEDGRLEMAEDNYIGKQVVTPEVVRPSGIIVDLGGKKEALRVTITNVPTNPICQVGDTVVTIDRYNYPLTYEGVEYIRLKSHEIVVTVKELEEAIQNYATH